MLEIITCLSKLPTGQIFRAIRDFLIQRIGSILIQREMHFTLKINCRHDALFEIQHEPPFCCKKRFGGEAVFQIY